MSSLRLSELLVGLSRIADIGLGFEPGEAARAAVIAAELARELGLPEPSDIYYVTLLQHIGCTAYAHEAAGLLGGDEIAVKAAAARTDFGDPADVLLGYLPSLAPGTGAGARLRPRASRPCARVRSPLDTARPTARSRRGPRAASGSVRACSAD
jgi:hypothetical protein